MNWKLAVVSVVVVLSVSALAQSNLTVQIPISTTIAGYSPWLDVKAYGAVGDGSHDDQPAIQAAITACPTNGCTIYFPSVGASGTRYKISSGLTINTKGVKLLGECGAIGTATNQTCSHLVSDQNITMLTVGTAGTSAFDSGLVLQDIGFQDISSSPPHVAGAVRLLQAADFVLTNVHCQDFTQGYCFLFDGNNGNNSYNFTQFGVVNSPFIINVKYPVQIVPQASEINFYGGNINCNDNSDTGATIGMDLGKIKGSAGVKSGGEFGIFGTHIYNCTTGISMWNFSNLNYYGVMEQTSGGYHGTGIVIDGDIAGKPTKSIIAGSMDEFVKGVVMQGTAPPQYTRILANISNIDPVNGAAIIASGTALSTAAIFTPVNFPAGVGGVAIGSQLPDLTIPGESVPSAPVSGSRRLYVDSGTGNNSDLSVERSDGTVVDLEGGLLNYQKPKATMGSGTVYTFSIPSIPAGKGVRARVFWQCATCTVGQSKTFSWTFGLVTATYAAYTNNNSALAYTEVRIFNNPGFQNQNTLVADGMTIGTGISMAGIVSSPNQDTSTAKSLTFSYSATSDTITPQGFILEAIQ